MELNNLEVLIVKDASDKAAETSIFELTDLQLAIAGGGIGETVLA